MRICLLTAHLSRHAGGLATSVPVLAWSLARRGDLDVHTVGLRDPRAPDDWREWGPQVHTTNTYGPRKFAWAPGLHLVLRELRPDVTDIQGIWTYVSVANLRTSRRTGQPYIVTPRGMLDAWLVRRRRWRKKLGYWLYESAHLKSARCLRATSLMEVRHLRAFGLRNPIAVIPNGLELPEHRTFQKGSRPTVLYLGRLHPKKGLDLLLHAWSRVEVQRQDWWLHIVGPDEEEHRIKLERMSRAMNLKRVAFSDPVYGETKWRVLGEADLFILPTRSENFGMAVAEALACGTPVIVSKGAPWASVEEVGCGWWVDVDAGALARALLEATAIGRRKLAEMGVAGRRFVEQHFASSAIAEQMVTMYRWVAGGGSPPPFVITD